MRRLTWKVLAPRGRCHGRKRLAVALAVIPTLVGLTAIPVAQAAAATPSILALDSDNEITDPGWFVQAYTAGYRLYVMATTSWGTCDPLARTQAQLKMALDAGLKIAVYTRDPNCWQAGITATGPLSTQLQFFALDVETGGSGVTRAMVTGVQGLGVRPVIYSGSGMWPEVMGDSAEFSDVALWDSDAGRVDYDGAIPDHLSPEPIPYGGWNVAGNMRIGVQQEFERSLNGVNIDVNSFDASFLY